MKIEEDDYFILFYFILFGTDHVHKITHKSIPTYFQCAICIIW